MLFSEFSEELQKMSHSFYAHQNMTLSQSKVASTVPWLQVPSVVTNDITVELEHDTCPCTAEDVWKLTTVNGD